MNLTKLKEEMGERRDSFLMQLRVDCRWDKDAFLRLVTEMEAYVRDLEPEAALPRWIAQGFWYMPTFVRDCMTHPRFPREHEPAYYERATMRLDALAYWLFAGTSLYEGDRLPPL